MVFVWQGVGRALVLNRVAMEGVHILEEGEGDLPRSRRYVLLTYLLTYLLTQNDFN